VGYGPGAQTPWAFGILVARLLSCLQINLHVFDQKKRKQEHQASLGRGRRHGDHCDIAPARRVTRSFGFLPRLTPGVASLCAVPSPGSPSSLLRRRRPGFKSSIGCDVRGAMRRSVSAPIHGSVAFAWTQPSSCRARTHARTSLGREIVVLVVVAVAGEGLGLTWRCLRSLEAMR
jgi:hypothetical protein